MLQETDKSFFACKLRERASVTRAVCLSTQPPALVHSCVGSFGWTSGISVPICWARHAAVKKNVGSNCAVRDGMLKTVLVESILGSYGQVARHEALTFCHLKWDPEKLYAINI